MNTILLIVLTLSAEPLAAGGHTRTLQVDGRERSYLAHVPPKYDSAKPTPVVLVLHGAGTYADINVGFTGMNAKSDEAGFLAVAPKYGVEIRVPRH